MKIRYGIIHWSTTCISTGFRSLVPQIGKIHSLHLSPVFTSTVNVVYNGQTIINGREEDYDYLELEVMLCAAM